ncbi:hypothetical protein [Cyclobacterium xiamenense]|uniref:hypothetical protein n=1 Tax=Cyclobacterium xiamenense TaxID=1297121 RepID=UPI0035CED0A2
MKTRDCYLLTFLFVLLFQAVSAQHAEVLRDTIRFEEHAHLDLLILAEDYHELKKSGGLKEVFESFQVDLNEIQEDLPEDIPYLVEYWHQDNVHIQPNPILKSYRFSGERELLENFRNRIIIYDVANKMEAIITFNDVAALLDVDFPLLAEEISNQLPERHRFLRSLEYRQDPSNQGLILSQDRFTGYMDMLSIRAGVGANVYQNSFLTDISGEIGIHLNQKGLLKDQFYISNNLLFSFSENGGIITNNFTNLGYRRNFSDDRLKPNWLGVEFGLVTKRSGALFKSNTMRLGVNWEIVKNISVAPQLYFNGFFKQVSPGFRIGIGL